MRALIPYEDYSREEVHAIFAPGTAFTPQSGTWGLHGIVPIPNRPGDFVFFVTFGQQQGEHVFDEGITEDGVLSWQSQPRQSLANPQLDFVHVQPNNACLHPSNRRHKLAWLDPPSGLFAYVGHLDMSHNQSCATASAALPSAHH